MPLISWSPSLELGIPSIDHQHRELVEMVNQLNEALEAGQGEAALNALVDRLVAYAATHFATEEGYFARYAYPDSQAHMEEHRSFTAQVTATKAKLDSGTAVMSFTVLHFLKDWLQHHIQQVDKAYAPFLKNKGVH